MLTEVWAQLAPVIQGPPFFPERMMGKLWIFKTVYFADVLTINERSLWLQGKQRTILRANNKINTFKQQWLDCPDKASGDVEKWDFGMLHNEVC